MDNPLQDDLELIAEHTKGLWDAENIFITGATGFIGKWILESLLWCSPDTKITILTRDPARFIKEVPHLASKVEIEQGNISTFDFTCTDYDYIIHAAHDKTPRNLSHLNINYHGAQRVSNYARIQSNLKSLLYISSGIAETPDASPYALGKYVSEFVLLNSNLPTKIARCYTFVGPYLPLNSNFAVGNFIYDGLQGNPITIIGTGLAHRSYMYAVDLMIWLWTILFNGLNNKIYNVGSPQIISIRSLAYLISQIFDHHPHIFAKYDPLVPASYYVPNVLETMQEFGLEIYTPLNEAIHKTIEWNKK